MAIGAFLAALSAGGNGAADELTQQEKFQNEQNLTEERAALEEQKAKSVAQFQNDLTNAPLNRAGAMLGNASQQQVQVTAPPITQLSGNDPTSPFNQGSDPNNMNADGQGLNVAADPTLLSRVNAMPDNDPNKQGILAQLRRQGTSDQQAAQDAVAGQTRAPTIQESIASAQKTALGNGDMQAYSALKTMAQDRYMHVPDGGAVIDTTTGNVLFQNTGKDERMAAHDDAMIERAKIASDGAYNRTMDALDKKLDANGGKVDTATGRMMITSLDMDLRTTTSQMAQLNAQLLVARPGDKSGIQDQIKTLATNIASIQGDKRAYFQQLGMTPPTDTTSLSTDTSSLVTPTAPIGLPPGSKQVGTSGGKPVYEDASGKRFIQQ